MKTLLVRSRTLTAYPGAIYHLKHDPESERLTGECTQPPIQQSFDVSFKRQAKETIA